MRPSRNYVIAAVLAGLLSLSNAVVALMLLPQGSAKLEAGGDQPPYAVVIIEVIIGLLGVVTAYGVYRVLRWAVIATLVLMVVNVLVSLPGIPFGPTTLDKLTSVASLVVAGLTIFFLLRRDRRPAVASVEPVPAEASA